MVESQRWADGVIVYQLDATLSTIQLYNYIIIFSKMHNANISLIISASEEDAVLQSAIDTFANKTCIKFKVRTNEVDYISVKKLSGLYFIIHHFTINIIILIFIKNNKQMFQFNWTEGWGSRIVFG